MDKQLACATFATVIPVLVIAGYFGSEIRELAERARPVRIMLWLAIIVFAVGEIVTIVGTASKHPTDVQVLIGQYACLLLVGGVTAAVVASLVAGRQHRHRQGSHDHDTTDDVGHDI